MAKPTAVIVGEAEKVRAGELQPTEKIQTALEKIAGDIGIYFQTHIFANRHHNIAPVKGSQLYITTQVDTGSNEHRIARDLGGNGCARILYTSWDKLEKDHHIPVLNIDKEYLPGDIARLKTRVEAFIERMER